MRTNDKKKKFALLYFNFDITNLFTLYTHRTIKMSEHVLVYVYLANKLQS